MSSLPFALLNLEAEDMSLRGYAANPEQIVYDSKLQTTNLINLGGKSEPTTMSQCAATTGNKFVGEDSDESEDDTGTD